jgi:hypothetical protein
MVAWGSLLGSGLEECMLGRCADFLCGMLLAVLASCCPTQSPACCVHHGVWRVLLQISEFQPLAFH